MLSLHSTDAPLSSRSVMEVLVDLVERQCLGGSSRIGQHVTVSVVSVQQHGRSMSIEHFFFLSARIWIAGKLCLFCNYKKTVPISFSKDL